ncbi:MAG: EMC3/TMCO1 family protein [Candidatus Aenigmatarchaeota archaeon]
MKMGIVESYYAALSVIFGPLLALPPVLGEAVMATIITLVITLFYKYMVNQAALRELKTQMKALQAKAKELQKTDPEEANKAVTEVLKLSNKQMRMNFKPMLPTLVLVMLLLPWMASVWKGPVAFLPFSLPYFGNDFGWLMWYLLLSIPMTQIFRKMLGVE